MTRRTISATALLVLLLSAGCGGGSAASEESGPEEFALTLLDQGSGQSGTATLTPLGDRTKVVLEVQDRSASPVAHPQPAHVHRGTCAELDPTPAYALSDVKDGKSTSTVAVKLSELRGGSFAINVHESAAQIEKSVACGDLGNARPRDADPLGHDKIDDY